MAKQQQTTVAAPEAVALTPEQRGALCTDTGAHFQLDTMAPENTGTKVTTVTGKDEDGKDVKETADLNYPDWTVNPYARIQGAIRRSVLSVSYDHETMLKQLSVDQDGIDALQTALDLVQGDKPSVVVAALCSIVSKRGTRGWKYADRLQDSLNGFLCGQDRAEMEAQVEASALADATSAAEGVALDMEDPEKWVASEAGQKWIERKAARIVKAWKDANPSPNDTATE